MQETNWYQPNDADRELIQRVISLVHRAPDIFKETGSWLDQTFSTPAIRKRRATEYREQRVTEKAQRPEEYFPTLGGRSRAYQRKHFPAEQVAAELGVDQIDVSKLFRPPVRSKGPDGRSTPPSIGLAERFWLAFDSLLLHQPALSVLPKPKRKALAMRQLMALWLYRDPDRAEVPALTEFQGLIAPETPNGLPPLIVDDSDSQFGPNALWIHPKAYLRRDSAAWLPKVQYALSEYERSEELQSEVGKGAVISEPPPYPDLKKPSQTALKAWLLYGTGRTQAYVAEELYGSRTKQYKVSRDIKSVKAYWTAGGYIEAVNSTKPKKSEEQTMDPAVLDQGPRRDGRTPRQRPTADHDA